MVRPLDDQGEGTKWSVVLAKYLGNESSFFNESLANPTLRKDILKHILKFLKTCQMFCEEGFKVDL